MSSDTEVAKQDRVVDQFLKDELGFTAAKARARIYKSMKAISYLSKYDWNDTLDREISLLHYHLSQAKCIAHNIENELIYGNGVE